ncbi:MAG: hypothetical protein WAZ77_16740 [Candidatus Nitrosopolaris sp.]
MPAHNWWQIEAALKKHGWKEVPTYEERMLYFQNGERTIGYEKSNNMTIPYTKTVLKRVGIDYESFVVSYSEGGSD